MKKINREHWKEVYYGDYVDHIEVNETDHTKRKSARYVSVEHIETGKLKIESWENEVMPTFFRTFKPGQILFGKRRAYQRKVAIADFEGICSPHVWALEATKELKQELLPFLMLTDKFYEYANANSAGTMSVYLKWPQLSRYKFLLPPPQDQNQIAALFQSLEIAIEQVEKQENNLKGLWQRLIDQFVCDVPIFGTLLIGKKIISVKFSDISKKISRRIDPITFGIKRRIGGENFISSDLKLRTWGEVGKDYVGPAFHMHVLPGDILYVSRNSHLRKVAYADFEGICSNTTYVIKANENVVLQNLLKHIMLSEGFTKFAISVTKGSTNPYLNWKDLDNFTFQIPDIETQMKISNVLDNILEVVEQHKLQHQTLKILKQKLLNEILG
jgi:type I restriction enzyme S subunit